MKVSMHMPQSAAPAPSTPKKSAGWYLVGGVAITATWIAFTKPTMRIPAGVIAVIATAIFVKIACSGVARQEKIPKKAPEPHLSDPHQKEAECTHQVEQETALDQHRDSSEPKSEIKPPPPDVEQVHARDDLNDEKSLAQLIVLGHVGRFMQDRGIDTLKSLARIVSGEKTLQHPPTSLPLSDQELLQFQELLQACPMAVNSLALINALGFAAYCALNALHQAAITDKQKNLECIFAAVKKQFCQCLLQGRISQAGCFAYPSSIGMTRQEFTENMNKFVTLIERNRPSDHQHPYQKHYDHVLNSLSILLKLWDKDPLLLCLYCYEIKQLTRREREQDHATEYQGVQMFIDFVICAFENTKGAQIGGAQIENDKITPFLHRTKTLYGCLHEKSQLSEHKQRAEVVKKQRILQQELFRVIERDQRQAQNHQVKLQDKVFFMMNMSSLMRQEHTINRNIKYIKYLEDIIFFLDQYAGNVIPGHVALQTSLIKIEVLNQILCRLITRLTPSVVFNVPKMDFFSAQQHKALSDLVLSMKQDIDRLLVVDQTVFRHAKKTAQSTALIRDLWEIYPDYHSNYPKIVQFSDTLHSDLKDLKKKHSQKCIEFINQLPLETCLNHSKEILNLFEDLLLACMDSFFVLHFFKQHLEKLFPESYPEPPNFFDTPLASYLLMEEFELAFTIKITTSVVSKMIENAKDADVSLNKEVTTAVKAPVIEKEPTTTTHQAGKEQRAKKTRKAKPQAQHKVTSPVSPKPRQTPPSAAVIDALKIRMGEKLDTIFQKLNDRGLDEIYSKGGHTTFATEAGFKVSLSTHDRNQHISPGAAHKLMKEVNHMLLKLAEQKANSEGE